MHNREGIFPAEVYGTSKGPELSTSYMHGRGTLANLSLPLRLE